MVAMLAVNTLLEITVLGGGGGTGGGSCGGGLLIEG